MNDESGNRACVLTPPGAGAIAVIRIAGPDALSITNGVFSPKGNRPLVSDAADRVRYGHILDGDEVLDDVVACIATDGAETAVDLCAHGGVRIVERILELLDRAGAHLADPMPGVPFDQHATSRVAADALRALPDAKTALAAKFLTWQYMHLAGHLRRVANACESEPTVATQQLAALVDGYLAARVLLDGATVAIIGPPNAGKSTLFNRLLGRTSAVVSSAAGTTRDWLAEGVELHGIPLTLIDTAGDADSHDELERRAVEAGRSRVSQANLALLVLDASAAFPDDLARYAAFADGRPLILVANKADAKVLWTVREAQEDRLPHAVAGVELSAKHGEGIDELAQTIAAAIGLDVMTWAYDRANLFTADQRSLAEEALANVPSGPVTAKRLILQRLVEL